MELKEKVNKHKGHDISGNDAVDMIRYGVIREKNKREIVMLRGSGCVWRRCRFCDYHLDFSVDQGANFKLNQSCLNQVTGIFKCLEVINSGSFVDLDEAIIQSIIQVCHKKGINKLHFECHWMHREEVQPLKKRFLAEGITVKVKIGVETFDALFRESYLRKGIDTDCAEEIAGYFDEVCLLQGLPGQTLESMKQDIETGLSYFERVCINIMKENTTPIRPDPKVKTLFINMLYPDYAKDERVDILLENTDFGVGEFEHE